MMRTLIEVQKLDGSGGVAKDAGELAALLGCELRHLIGPLKMDNCFRYGYEWLGNLDVQETANRFDYLVEFNPVDGFDVLMIQRNRAMGQ